MRSVKNTINAVKRIRTMKPSRLRPEDSRFNWLNYECEICHRQTTTRGVMNWHMIHCHNVDIQNEIIP